MAGSLLGTPFSDKLASEHRTWLSVFDPQYLANWEKMLNSDEESALAEAGVRRLLQGYGVEVRPNEDLTGAEQSVDFHCDSHGGSFKVEVTHISIEKATKVAGIPRDPTVNLAERSPGMDDVHRIRSLNDAIFGACKGKARQCSEESHPTLLAVATFHYGAAVFCFERCDINELLTGKTRMRVPVGNQSSRQAGDAYLVTELHSAVFLRRNSSEPVGFARSSISALLLCGLCTHPPKVIGVLHPNPARPFNLASLPQIQFGQVLIDGATRQLHVAWPHGDDE